jgi:hypothetical protein
MYGHIRQELHSVATSTLPWAVELHNPYHAISNMGGISESDLAVLSITLKQDFSDYAGPDVELVVSPVENAVASATQSTCTTSDFRRSLSFGRLWRGSHSAEHFAYSSCPCLP